VPENAHERTATATHSSDHILDVEIDAGGEIRLKDEDELEAAMEQGRIAPHEAEQITRHADAAIAAFHDGHWAFAREWIDWRPDPA
jgi:predicted RNA-binding protein associated with RNAse of E/G family